MASGTARQRGEAQLLSDHLSQKNPMLPGWQRGRLELRDQPTCFSALNAYAKMSGDCIALSGATGVWGVARPTRRFFPPAAGADAPPA
jgi:hypothetical protein